MAIQQAQMAEQKKIAEAPPPPAPQETAAAAAPALETAGMTIPVKQGVGRRKLRTDVGGMAGGVGGLTIPGA